jgi:uncharacterized protein (DUF58 family)
VAFGGEVVHAVPPRKGPKHGFGVVHDALALPTSAGGPGLSAALERCTRMVRRRSTVFVLSDFLQFDWQDAMALCARHHDVVALPLLPPEYFEPPDAGVRRAWRDAAEQRLLVLRKQLRRAGADRVEIQVPREASMELLAAPLQSYFERRKRRRRSG